MRISDELIAHHDSCSGHYSQFKKMENSSCTRNPRGAHLRQPNGRSLRFEPLEARRLLATFSVINTADAGAGSLRQAMLDANGSVGADVIDFNIGGGPQTITPTSALPIITEAVVIDATTQPGFAGSPIIELSGTRPE